MQTLDNETQFGTVTDIDAAKGVYDTTKFAAPGIPYPNRKPMTPEQLEKVAADAKKQAAKIRGQELSERAGDAVKQLANDLAQSGIPKLSASLLAAEICELKASVLALEEEIKSLKAR